jgi:hypothetical protein
MWVQKNPNGASNPGCGAYAVPELQDMNTNMTIPFSELGLQACSGFDRFI